MPATTAPANTKSVLDQVRHKYNLATTLPSRSTRLGHVSFQVFYTLSCLYRREDDFFPFGKKKDQDDTSSPHGSG